MKQSKKLLSIFLSLLMLLGTVSVVGNAALVKSEVAYDSIDNAKLTPEQVADIILDMLDNDVLSGIDVNVDILGIKINLSSVDNVFVTLDSLQGPANSPFVGGIFLGDLYNLDFDAVVGKPKRSDAGGKNDLNLVYKLLQFLADNASLLSKAVNGGNKDIGGLSIGIVGSFVDLGSINGILKDIPGFLSKTVFDMLIYGSYGYDKDAEELGTLPTEADTLDEIVNTAVTGLLTKPQKYEWVPVLDSEGKKTYDGEGNVITKKVWDMDSKILNLTEQQIKDLDLNIANNSIFSILYKALPIAYETFGTVVLNHDVKKIFMEAMGVDFVRITDAKEIADITKAGTGYINVNGEGSDSTSAADKAKVKNYFCNAQMWQVDGTWYFRDYVTTEIGTDDEGNPITEKRDRFFKAQTYSVDELYNIFNWDYELTASDLDFATMTSANGYGSLVGSLNHILYVILKKAINPTAIGLTSIDELWVDGPNTNFNENLMKTAKFLLKNYTFMFFGRNEAYVDLNTLEATDAFKAKVDSFGNDAAGREGLIAYMLLPLLGDVLPQLVYTTDMFEPGLQIEQVAALLVREFLTDLTPQINDYVCDYDSLIFADPTLNNGRSLKKGQDSAYWMNLVLNMGLDLAAIYLDNITNFNVDLNTLKTLHTYAKNGAQPWEVVLEEIVDWAVNFVGLGGSSVLAGCDPNTLGAVRCVTAYNAADDTVTVVNNFAGNNKAFDILSTVLNKLLPLGMLCNVTSDSHDLDVKMLFDRIVDLIDDLDLEVLLNTFGNNTDERAYNILNTTNIPKVILDLVNQLISCIFGTNLFPYTATIHGAVGHDRLPTIVTNLLGGLNTRKKDLLENALPVVALFVSDWGGEQELASPEFGISNTTKADAGNLNVTLDLRNGSKGVWRSYMNGTTRTQDEQYTYNIISITSLQGLGISSDIIGKNLAYGKTASVTLSKSGVPATGLADRIDITYTVSDENGNLMANGAQFTKSYFTYVSYEDNELRNERHGSVVAGVPLEIDTPQNLYYAEEDLENIATNACLRYYNDAKINQTGKLTNSSGTQNGITLKNDSWTIKGETVYKEIFSFDRSKYTSVGHAGAKYTFTYKLNNGKGEGSYSTNVFVYSGADYGLLEDLVNDEVSKARVASDYKDTALYNDYLGKLANGMAIIYNPRVDANFWTDCYARYEALLAAVEALEAVEKTDAEKAAAGGSIDGLVDNLKTQLDGIQNTKLDGKDYRTYMLYRWEKYKSARSDANWIIDLKEEVKFGAPKKHFPYGSYSQAKYTNLVAGDKYEAFLKGLLVDMTEEELAAAKENFDNRTAEYYGQTTLDVAQYANLLTRTSQRLITRTTTPVTSYLQKEINSAEKDIGTSQGNYSEKSWTPYAKALADAKAALTSDSQDVIFAAKYQLQVTRNNLRSEAKEADYEELNTLITQAENALNTQAANKNTYANGDEDFGKLLVALGYTTEGGTKLFGGAKDVFNTSYDKHDQDEVDDAADELKAALAKLEFKNFETTKPNTVGTTAVETGETDENGEAVKENIYTTTIDPKQVSSVVAAAVKGNNDWTVQVSLDEKYSATDGKLEKLPVGTGATVTVFKIESGVNVPVATIKVIVKGDVTGDGVIDGLDCMVVDLVANNNTSLGGVYLEAGDLASNAAGEQRITIKDLEQVVNKAIA